jgi:phosphoserine phosphatase RsbX
VAVLTLHYGVATFVTPGQRESGDLEVVRHFDGGAVVAVIDGIGHGDEAAAAAGVAREIIARRPQDPPAALVMRCHEALRLTRGVVLSIASINLRRPSLSWLGVGNVSGLVQHARAEPARDELLLRAGVVGAGGLPRLKTSEIPLRELDTLVFATDGIRPQFADAHVGAGSPQSVANEILARYCHGSDDALVLVARTKVRTGSHGREATQA